MAELPDVPENLVIGADTPETPESTTSTPAPAAGTPETPGSVPSATVPPSTPSPSNPAIPAAEPKFEIKVDGKVELLTKAEVIALAQQGKSFTQKSQRLADDQRRWEADRQAILQQEREAAIKEWQAKIEREKTEAAKDPGTRAIERVQTLEQKLEDQALDAVLKPLVAKYDLDEQMFCIEATKHGLRTAEDVAARGEAIAKAMSEHQNSRFESRFKETLSKGDHPELKALLEKHIADYLAKKVGGPSPVPAGATAPALGAAPRKARTLDEAADIAEEMLTGVPARQ